MNPMSESFHGRNRCNSRGDLAKVVGQCNTNDKYGHNYLDCDKCHVTLDVKCDIENCPCNHHGYLFPVVGDDQCFSHQIPGHVYSVRIYKNRPKRAVEAVLRSIKRSEYICSNPASKSREIKRRRMSKDSVCPLISSQKSNINNTSNAENEKCLPISAQTPQIQILMFESYHKLQSKCDVSNDSGAILGNENEEIFFLAEALNLATPSANQYNGQSLFSE